MASLTLAVGWIRLVVKQAPSTYATAYTQCTTVTDFKGGRPLGSIGKREEEKPVDIVQSI